jgi:hypothetical protein
LFLSTEAGFWHFRFRLQADIPALLIDFRFTPDSVAKLGLSACLMSVSARSGHYFAPPSADFGAGSVCLVCV